MLHNGLKFKLFVLVLSCFITVVLGLVFYIFPTFESFFVDQKKNEIKSGVEIIIGTIEKIQLEIHNGILTPEQGLAEARKIFALTRYGEDDYFFAYDARGYNVAHGLTPDKVGKDLSKVKDADGKSYVQEFIEIAKNKSDGFVFYKHERLEEVGAEDKISYVKFYEPWGWLVGTGVYISAIQNQIAATKTKIYTGLAVVIALALFGSVIFAIKLSQKLSEISDELQSEAQEVEKVAQKMSSISESLSSSTTQQAAALQETSSSVEETSAMIERNAHNARSSIDISHKSQNSVNIGRDIIAKMMNSINDIAKSNEEIIGQIDESNREIGAIVSVINQIGDKTKVINDIVFQTKLLSFNASVEAARAGEQGKGFAVVAEEVGNLAQMSGKSANEISDMLAKSISHVESTVQSSKTKIDRLVESGEQKIKAGTAIAHECLNIFNQIVSDVSRVTEMVEEISTASTEQSNGVREINLAITELDSVAQQNSSMSQDTATTAEQLQAQVISLKKMTNTLRKTVNG